MLKLDVSADVAKATEHLSDAARQHVPTAAAKALTWYSTYTPNAALTVIGLCVANQSRAFNHNDLLTTLARRVFPCQRTHGVFSSG